MHAGPGVILEHTNQLVLVERWCSACWCRHAADCSMRRLGVRHRQHTTVNARIGSLNREEVVQAGPVIIVEHTNQLVLVRRWCSAC